MVRVRLTGRGTGAWWTKQNLKENKDSAEVDIAPAFGEITTACQGQLLCKVSSSQLTLLQRVNFISRLNVNFLDSMQNFDKVSGA